MRGAGIWLRRSGDITPARAAEMLDFVVVALHSGERGRINRRRKMRRWCEEYVGAGGRLHAMDALPLASKAPDHLPEMVDFARLLGCIGVMIDAEPDTGWRHSRSAALNYGRELVAVADDLVLSMSDWGRGGQDAATMRAFLEAVDVGVPQSYDPGGSKSIDYHARSARYWRARGARRLVMGLGLWLRGKKRHRTVEEFRQHLANIPDDVDGACVWYASTRKGPGRLDEILPMLRQWSDARTVRATDPAPAAFDRARIGQLAEEAMTTGDVKASDALWRARAGLLDVDGDQV